MSDKNYRVIDKESYYRSGVYRHFTLDCKCSVSMTARLDVTALAEFLRQIEIFPKCWFSPLGKWFLA